MVTNCWFSRKINETTPTSLDLLKSRKYWVEILINYRSSSSTKSHTWIDKCLLKLCSVFALVLSFFWKIIHIPAYPELLKSSHSACDKTINWSQSLVRWLVLPRNQKWWKTATGGKLRNTSSLLCRERNLNTNIIIFNLHGNSIKTFRAYEKPSNTEIFRFAGSLMKNCFILLWCVFILWE